ncbi:MAG: hypothetical protein AB1Z98_07280, partial [Nannocystaceae bacterium]
VVVALVVGGLGKLAVDTIRVDQVLTTAHQRLVEGTPEDLLLAAVSLEQGPDDPQAHATLALVRALQAIDGTVPIEAAEKLAAEADDGPEAVVARGIVAVLRGEVDRTPAAPVEIDPAAPHASLLRQAQAWVQAGAAVNGLDEPADLDLALRAIDDAQAEASGFDRSVRVAAAACFRAGRVEEAHQRLEEGLRLHPTDLGPKVDRVLYDAVLAHDLDAAEALARELLRVRPALAPRDASRAGLARALIELRRRDDGDARAALDRAYGELEPADHLARVLALEVALSRGAWEMAERWVDEGALPELTTRVHRAWIALAKDEVASSLRQLARLPQTHPYVAMVQGLALVEQGRHQEARVWLGRASESFPHRPLLRVAMARTEAAVGDALLAVERLEAYSRRYPDAARVWTGLAEALAHTAKGGHVPDNAEPALHRALEQEPYPARAAYLLGLRHQTLAVGDPRHVVEALAMFRRAVELRGWVPEYRETLGRYLAEVGDRDEARRLLEGVADEPTTEPTSLLLLAELAAESAVSQGHPPAPEISGWLALAARRGAPADVVIYTHARIALGAGTAEGVVQARSWIEPWLRKHRRDVEARLIHVEALRRAGDIGGARASIRAGMRRTRGAPDGRLLLASARVERDAGKERRAVVLAQKGWRQSLKDARPANELLDSAELTIERWHAVEDDGRGRRVARELTRRVPYRARAWVLRSRVQLEGELAEPACDSARAAVKLEPDLPEARGALAACSAGVGGEPSTVAALDRPAPLAKAKA